MSSTWGNRLKITLFGESHGSAIGAVIDGLPAGIHFNKESLHAAMMRRAPGNSNLTTSRQETDKVRILSGIYNSRLSGAPVCGIIENEDVQPHDDNLLKRYARPSHADYPAYVKFSGNNDPRGGGHFSGRITAPLVFAGELCRAFLADMDIYVGAHIFQIGPVFDNPFSEATCSREEVQRLSKERFPLINNNSYSDMQDVIIKAKTAGDSVGGIVECAAVGLPVGLGSPFFDSMESIVAHLLFSIPAVKGVSFGEGFSFANMHGSDANDGFMCSDTGIKLKSNHAGGLNGGLTNGMPLIARAAFRPTPSIALMQDMVDLKDGNVEVQCVPGRHDPCVVPRALPAVEAAIIIALSDAILSEFKK